RFSRDWSSDVCSSDLLIEIGFPLLGIVIGKIGPLSIGLKIVQDQSQGLWAPFARDLGHLIGEPSVAVPEIPAAQQDLKGRGHQRSEERRVGKGCRTRG